MDDPITKNVEVTEDKVGNKENDRGLRKRHFNGIDFLLNNTFISKNSRILDLGCREGLLLDRLNSKVKTNNLYGVDISEVAINYLNSKYKKITGYVQDIHSLEFPNDSFDIVICTHTLEHSNDPYQVLSEIYRVLNKNGICMIEVPIENGDKPKTHNGHFYIFKEKQELIDIMKNYFKIINYGNNPHKTKNWFMIIGKKEK